MTAASIGAVAVSGGVAHAADTYHCGTTLNAGDLSITGCLHLGGNGYWQPYLVVGNGGGQQISGSMWINSGGVYSANGTQGLSYYLIGNAEGNFVVWGTSTNWRVTCYVQAQEDIYIDGGYLGRVYSPSLGVC